MVREYDVIVVGAGPAGSTTARECAARGLSVLLLDSAEFPRDKPCGGGVNVRAARMLPFDLAPVTERTITGMKISVNQGSSYWRDAGYALTYLTQRRRLDAFLAEKAIAGGAEMRERAAVREVERSNGHVLVRTAKEAFSGRCIVAADGANGPTAKLAGIASPRLPGIALEGNITPDVYPERWRSAFGIDVGGTPGGYGWLFPKGDHVNIGVGGWYHIGPTLRTRLDRLSKFYGFDPKDFWGLRGYPLPVRKAGAPLVDRNIVLVGDAAGLLDPLTGEGIFSALASGEAAARHVADYCAGRAPDLRGYGREIEAGLGREMGIAVQIHLLFHAAPFAWAAFVHRSSRAWRVACGLITGDLSYSGIKRRSRMLAIGIDAGAAAVSMAARMNGDRRVRALAASMMPFPSLPSVLPSLRRADSRSRS